MMIGLSANPAANEVAPAEPHFPRGKMSFPLAERLVVGAEEYRQDCADSATWRVRSGEADWQTTRLRRLPYRQFLRQSIRPEAMLTPEQIHRVEVLCAGEHIELRLDGRTVLRVVDPNPYRTGHFGVLGFVRPLHIRNLRVHRAVAMP